MKRCSDGGRMREVHTKTTMTKDGYFLDGDMEAPGLTNVPYDADWSRYRDAEVGLTDLLPDEAKGGVKIRGRFHITVTFVANPFSGADFPTCDIGEPLIYQGDCWRGEGAGRDERDVPAGQCPGSSDRTGMTLIAASCCNRTSDFCKVVE